MRRRIEMSPSTENLVIPGNFVSLIKTALYNTSVPVVIDVPVWFNSSGKFDAGWDWGPDVHLPTPAHLKLWLETFARPGRDKAPRDPPGIDGWHAIPICGFDDTTKRFAFKNSWAPWWGDKGFGTIPYEYITQYSRSGMIGLG